MVRNCGSILVDLVRTESLQSCSRRRASSSLGLDSAGGFTDASQLRVLTRPTLWSVFNRGFSIFCAMDFLSTNFMKPLSFVSMNGSHMSVIGLTDGFGAGQCGWCLTWCWACRY